ncbi:MAG: DUF2849 domain-containing protein [Pseudodonghicola sp.]|nr:DUF2849 domain-containing protein [Pseudodonghicola sp.]
MSRPFGHKIVTASDLLAGDVIYQTADDRWSRQLDEAELITDEAHAQLRLLHADRQQGHIVGPYLAEVRPGPRGPEPIHFREAFRATGPSNYAHGKQTDL